MANRLITPRRKGISMEDTSPTLPSARAGRREWLGLAVLALPTLLVSVDLSVLFLALPHIGEDLGASSIEQLWITDIYGFMVAGFLVTMGTLGDRVGRRRLLLIGAAAFGVASVLAAYSTTPEMLIASRALLGIAGSTLMPSCLALISNMFQDLKQRGLAIGVWVACFMGGGAVGPVVGGLLLDHYWWGSVFLLGVPVMLVILITGPLLLPEFRDLNNAPRLDLTSVALSLAAILPTIYGLKELAKDGWTAVPILAVVVGIGIGVVFVRRQLGLAHPLLDMHLFGNRTFSSALGVNLLGSLVVSGSMLLFTLYLQTVQGLSALQSGLWMIPSAIATMTSAFVAPMIARRVRPGIVIAVGLVISAIGFGVLSQVEATSSLLDTVIGIVIVSIGAGTFASLGIALIVGAVRPEQAGSAAAVSETSGQFGIALGVAIMGSIGIAVYRGQLDVPAGVPAQAAETASRGIDGAIGAAAHLPPDAATGLLNTARDSFTAGLNVVAAVGAVLAVGLAILGVTVLRHARPTGEADTQQEADAAGEEADPALLGDGVEPS